MPAPRIVEASLDGSVPDRKPLEDEANVDRRRAETSLPSLAEYNAMAHREL